MAKTATGLFTELDGEHFYKIANYDFMEDFFMTITSASDVWNFCWAQGGVTAGRVNADKAIFPYYTADKVSDMKGSIGPYTAIAVEEAGGKTEFWEPFASLLTKTARRYVPEDFIERNLYKNDSGTKIWFEEVNRKLGLAFRYGWTSSGEYGLVRLVKIENRGSAARKLVVLDGCRNILPACISSVLQNNSSILLEAYKQTDWDEAGNLALFALSSVVSDKAEPSEGLLANVCWFSTADRLIISPDAPKHFFEGGARADAMLYPSVLKGESPSCFIVHPLELAAGGSEQWYQVFDCSLNASKIAALKEKLGKKDEAVRALVADIAATADVMTQYISEADGIQHTAQEMTCIHHRANVMFNIMRGGFFADNGKVNAPDFLAFVHTRNRAKEEAARSALGELAGKNSLPRKDIEKRIKETGDAQLERLFLEYLPIIFSRRHGDPSRPWNKFNIKLAGADGNPILNYEGNWRDIFQNWEALLHSYPSYAKHVVAKFVNAMTADGFNPYRISRDGIDWECPEPGNPWAQYGYWGDHQVIYLQKLLEFLDDYSHEELDSFLNRRLFTSSNVPYRLKSYAELCINPRSSLLFDKALSDRLCKESEVSGTDKKLVQGTDGQPELLSLTAKLLQIVMAKAANLVPGGGIWMNTQRPEWNDANNALAGWGLSVVTLCYLERMLSFLIGLYAKASSASFTLPAPLATCFYELHGLYEATPLSVVDDAEMRKAFVDKAGGIFEKECKTLYVSGYGTTAEEVSREQLVSFLRAVQKLVEQSIRANRRSDGLYHTYNTLKINANRMEVETLQEMLEGQVAVLSSGLLSSQEALAVISALKQSKMYEKRQHSYMLYPDKELPSFEGKNNVAATDLAGLESFIAKSGTLVLEKDVKGVYHFNPQFHNARLMKDFLSNMGDAGPDAKEQELLLALYEKTFHHQSFTGRSGTFYAYEGLGSIYWHMVSKLLLAVQECALASLAKADGCAAQLEDAYKRVKNGLGFNKSPELYGAFPFDPYSHTPSGKGAKQPGMTGQVKEEILTRWMELGAKISGGKALFDPQFLPQDEFFADGTLSFCWCGTPVRYEKGTERSIQVHYADGSSQLVQGNALPLDMSRELFARTGKLKELVVSV